MRNDRGAKPLCADRTRQVPMERNQAPEALDPAAAFALGNRGALNRLVRPGRPPVRKTAAGQ